MPPNLPDGALWYFGYGSNMSRATFLERRGMCPLATRIGCLDDYRLCFDIPVGPGERGVANLASEAGARTWGVLYAITSDEAARLDGTEGVPHLYRRLAVRVGVSDGIATAAFTYQSTRVDAARKPSERYLGILLDGAREHGLPEEYITALARFERAIDERVREA